MRRRSSSSSSGPTRKFFHTDNRTIEGPRRFSETGKSEESGELGVSVALVFC